MTRIVLIAGLWLDASAWDDVAAALESRGHRPVPVALPGQGDGATSATLDDQLTAVLAAVDADPAEVLVVGHSAACTLAWLTADARPDRVARAALIGGFPSADGEAYAAFVDMEDGAMPFPGWAAFEGPDSEDLDQATRDRIAAGAIPVPRAVSNGVVRLTDERRYDVPVTLVCPEFSPAQAQEWVAGGASPELAKVRRLDYVDIDSGHWPMFSRPKELAAIIADLAES